MTALTLTARQFASLVKPVMPLASRSDMDPNLNAVRISTSGEYVKATATDRFRIGIQRMKVHEGPLPEFDALVPLASVKQILALFKPTRAIDPELEFTAAEDRIIVSQAGGFFDTAQASFYTRPVKDAPRLESLIRDWTSAPTEQVALNAHYIADFAHAVTNGESMVVRFQGHNKPIVVTIGEDFIGMQMPTRLAGVDGVPDRDVVDNWREFLAAPVAEAVSA